MMKNMEYMPGMGRGKEGRWVVEFPNFKTQLTKEGLRFFESCDRIKKNLGTFNKNFVKDRKDFPYFGFLKLWVGKDGKVYLGQEIFFKEKLTFTEKPTVLIKEVQEEVDWMDYMDAEAMKTMLKMERNVLAITNEEPSDPSTFIIPIVGQLNNWTWLGFSKNVGKKVCTASPNVLFNIFYKMNSNLAYFDVSYIIEILHLNDSKEFENSINKQLEKKIEPVEPTFETLNWGNDENSHLIKIGSILNVKDRKDLKELLTEFQEVFAWSYEDMSDIDPEIA